MKIRLTDPSQVSDLRDYLRGRGYIAHLVPADPLALQALRPGATPAQEASELPLLVAEWQQGATERRATFEG